MAKPVGPGFLMRIIAGTYRRLRIASLRGNKLRPTSDQLRETLFDVLGPAVRGSTFLDAYAGTGAVGIEALSRGASQVVFIERHKPAAELIRRNLEALKIISGFRLMTCQVKTGLERLSAEGARFQFVFIDPPYDEIYQYHHVLRQLGRSELVGPGAVVVAEHLRSCTLEQHYASLKKTRVLRHGDAQLAFYEMESSGTIALTHPGNELRER